MASNLPKHTELTGISKPAKVLTAGFNSPVPACTLQVTPDVSKPRRPEFSAERTVTPSSTMAHRSWFVRLREIF